MKKQASKKVYNTDRDNAVALRFMRAVLLYLEGVDYSREFLARISHQLCVQRRAFIRNRLLHQFNYREQ